MRKPKWKEILSKTEEKQGCNAGRERVEKRWATPPYTLLPTHSQRSISCIAAPQAGPVNDVKKENGRPFSILEGWPVSVTIHVRLCGPIRKKSYGDYKHRSVLSSAGAHAPGVCVHVCVLGVGQAGITLGSSRDCHICIFNPPVERKAFFLPGCVRTTFTHMRLCGDAASIPVWIIIPTDRSEHKLMFWDILWISMPLLPFRILTAKSEC